MIQKHAVFCVNRNVCSLPGTFCCDALEKAWCVDVAKCTSRSADGGICGFRVLKRIRHEYIPDALSRQRKGFAVGVADKSVTVVFGDKRQTDVIVDKLAVRFVRDQEDRVAEHFAFLGQKLSQLPDRFLGVDRAGRVVR